MSFSAKKISALTILNLASFFQYQRYLMPILFLFYLHNGLSFSDFIFFQSIFCITCLIAKLLFGFIGDIFSKKYLLILAYTFFLIRVCLWYIFGGYWYLLAGEILYGLFKVFYTNNIDSYIYEWLKVNNLTESMLPKYGKLSFYTSLGSAISCCVGVVLYMYFGFKIVLLAEIIMQVAGLVLLFFIPNIQKNKKKKAKIQKNFKRLKYGFVSLFHNKKINYYVYYSSMLSGLTSVFVWNFQYLLKLSSASVILYGAVSFINQIFRAMAGFFAPDVMRRFLIFSYIKIQYIVLILSFIFLITSFVYKNYLISFAVLIFICFAIFLYVIFNIFTVARLHENTCNYRRATTSSINMFFRDFASFIFLLIFKCLIDNFGIIKSLLIFMCFSTLALFPNKKLNHT